MTNDPLAPYRWLQAADGDPANPLGDIFCVSFFRGLGPAEVLRRFDPAGPAGRETSFDELGEQVLAFVEETDGGDGGGHVGVVQAGEWCVAIELWGWTAALTEALTPLSKGCEVVVVSRHDYAEDDFSYAVDGAVVTTFRPIMPSERHGSDLHRLDDLMREVGLTPEEAADGWEAQWHDMSANGLARAFLLAARITGVEFTAGLLAGPLLVGAIGEF
ncbi:hypothetical protein E1267_14790 [Nonomuraea longispora]|uniref:Uncharacterized protein n=1 Tax=Nonomuraea longispora TaxID=1848320 RepID=A0A4R4NF45_9ACTN|nr:DUF6461 domain-containing protein [Nonomuraea longispora]TDC07014.1 hypothetical protein E1267_14790 [Nonomuraea longispora]